MNLTKREFLAAGVSSLALAGITVTNGTAFAQEGAARSADVPHKVATTKFMFKSPSGYPNALASTADGLWVAEQKRRGAQDGTPLGAQEAVWLMDANGKVLKTIMTPGRNTSGLAIGNGSLWSCALSAGEDGIYQTDMNGKLIAHRQCPLGPANDGGGIHGAFWQDGKLWVFANRLNAMVRINPTTWVADYVMPVSGKYPRYHGAAWDNGSIWIITGNATASYATGTFGFEKYDAASGRVTEVVDFARSHFTALVAARAAVTNSKAAAPTMAMLASASAAPRGQLPTRSNSTAMRLAIMAPCGPPTKVGVT